MSYLSEGDVCRHEKFDNFLNWSAVLTGAESSLDVVGGTVRSNSDILSNNLSRRQTDFLEFLFSFSSL